MNPQKKERCIRLQEVTKQMLTLILVLQIDSCINMETDAKSMSCNFKLLNNHKLSPKSPEIGGGKHSQMAGVIIALTTRLYLTHACKTQRPVPVPQNSRRKGHHGPDARQIIQCDA